MMTIKSATILLLVGVLMVNSAIPTLQICFALPLEYSNLVLAPWLLAMKSPSIRPVISLTRQQPIQCKFSSMTETAKQILASSSTMKILKPNIKSIVPTHPHSLSMQYALTCWSLKILPKAFTGHANSTRKILMTLI